MARISAVVPGCLLRGQGSYTLRTTTRHGTRSAGFRFSLADFGIVGRLLGSVSVPQPGPLGAASLRQFRQAAHNEGRSHHDTVPLRPPSAQHARYQADELVNLVAARSLVRAGAFLTEFALFFEASSTSI